MNRSEFFKAVCLHYGKESTHDGKPVLIPREYDQIRGKGVADWLRAYAVTHEDFQSLFTELKKRYSTSYGKLPDEAKLQAAADALLDALPVKPRELPPEPTDAERDTVVAGLAEIMAMAKYGKRVERNEPYRD